MTRKTPITAALFVAAALALGVASDAVAVDDAIQQADRNGDASVDRGEYHQRMTDVFYGLDGDRDGVLVLTELDGVSADGLRAADRNGDGKLSLNEYVNARFDDFDAADADGDGVLSRAEVAAW